MKLLILKPVVIGIQGTNEHATHAKAGEIVELSKESGLSIISVEKGVDITRMDPKKVKELQQSVEEAEEEKAKSEAAAARALRIQNREPKTDSRDPETE